MTLTEKVGQLNQYNDDWQATGPVTLDSTKADQVRNGMVGSLLNCVGTNRTRKWQEIAMQSRLKHTITFWTRCSAWI
jgi:beta-glucosidase